MDTMQINKSIFRIDTGLLLEVIKSIKDLIGEVTFNIDSSGLNIIETDPSNVTMINVVIDKIKFIELTDKNTEITLNVDSLYKALKDNKKTDVSFNIENDTLLLSFSNDINTILRLINNEDRTKQKLPDLSFKTIIEITTKKLKEIIKTFSNVGDSILIEVVDNKLIFSSSNDLKESSNITLSTNNLNYYLKIDGDNTKCKYSLEYLIKFIKANFTEVTKLKLSEDYPLNYMQEFEGFKIGYILAPRIE